MCGICGVYAPSMADEQSAILAAMNQALWHRGPDDGGQFDHQTCSMAMRRLSIIDVAGGQQPIFNESGSLAVVFNGEIYNFPELRAMLQARGHQFVTNSDTEVIVHLYEDEGEQTPNWLKGMFAFCVLDQRDNTLFLARDRFGEKPLYYYNNPSSGSNSGFAFSSEINSLLACPFVPRQLNHEALGYYLRIGFVPVPITLFQGIHILPPGHWLRYRNGQIDSQPYFTIDYQPDPKFESEEAATEAVRTTLRTAVQRQAISDVPLGAFLSGGVDSSSVVAMLQSVSTRPVKTFTMRFEDAAYDEGAIAKEVATQLGTEHLEFVVPNVAFCADDLWRIVDHVGLPFVDSSAIPTYLISKHIGNEVTVALSGDGGDELFAGYPAFQWGMSIRRMQALPQPLLQGGAAASKWLSQQPAFAKVGPLRRMARGLAGAALPSHHLPVALYTIFEPSELATLLCNQGVLDIATGDLPYFTALPAEAETWSPLRQLMYYRLKHTLHDRMLTKVDRMSMAASIEVRTPMLDVDLAALSMRLPDKHLIQKKIGKSILRKAMRGLVPEIVFNHPKTGFDVPLHSFQNAAYHQLAHSLLSNRQGIMQLFAPEAVEATLHLGTTQRTNQAHQSLYRASHQLWALMQLAAWAERFHVVV